MSRASLLSSTSPQPRRAVARARSGPGIERYPVTRERAELVAHRTDRAYRQPITAPPLASIGDGEHCAPASSMESIMTHAERNQLKLHTSSSWRPTASRRLRMLRLISLGTMILFATAAAASRAPSQRPSGSSKTREVPATRQVAWFGSGVENARGGNNMRHS